MSGIGLVNRTITLIKGWRSDSSPTFAGLPDSGFPNSWPAGAGTICINGDPEGTVYRGRWKRQRGPLASAPTARLLYGNGLGWPRSWPNRENSQKSTATTALHKFMGLTLPPGIYGPQLTPQAARVAATGLRNAPRTPPVPPHSHPPFSLQGARRHTPTIRPPRVAPHKKAPSTPVALRGAKNDAEREASTQHITHNGGPMGTAQPPVSPKARLLLGKGGRGRNRCPGCAENPAGKIKYPPLPQASPTPRPAL